MEKENNQKINIEPRAIFEVENGWPDDPEDDPTTTLATVTFTHLNLHADFPVME